MSHTGTNEQVELADDFDGLAMFDQTAANVWDLHYVTDRGQCAECLRVVKAATGVIARPGTCLWPCNTAYAARHGWYGWTDDQVYVLHEEMAGRPLDSDDFEAQPLMPDLEDPEVIRRREAWVTSEIPAGRVLRYVSLGFSLPEALAIEHSGRTEEELDSALATMVALGGARP